MERKKRSWIILGVLIVLIIGTIYSIEYIKGMGNGEEEELKCVAEKSILYVSKTCSHCANQKLILGDGLQYFELIDCAEDTAACQEAGITGVPTWEIDGELYPGVRSVEQLKELTGC